MFHRSEKKNRIAKKLLSLMFALLIISQCGVFTAAAEVVPAVKNAVGNIRNGFTNILNTTKQESAFNQTYVLEVTTGSNNGSNIVSFITIDYYDVDGRPRTQAVFPQEQLNLSTRYTVVSTNNVKVQNAKKLGFDVSSWKLSSDALTSMSTDTYVLNLFYEIGQIQSIQMHGATSTGNWDLKSFRLYKVSKINGSGMYGYISPSTYLDFEGTKIAESAPVTGFITLSLEGAGTVITFGNPFGNTNQKIPQGGTSDRQMLIVYPNSSNYNARWGSDHTDGYITYKRYKNETDYNNAVNYSSNNSEENYMFELDIADVLGGGIETMTTLFGSYPFLSASLTGNDYTESLAAVLVYLDTEGIYRRVLIPVTTSYISWAMEKYDDAASGKSILDSVAWVAQRGDSLKFPVNLPNFVSVAEILVMYGNTVIMNTVENGFGVSAKTKRVKSSQTTFNGLGTVTDRVNVSEGTSDSISIAGISISKIDDPSSVTVSVDGYNREIVVNASTTPLYYYKSESFDGTVLSVDNQIDLVGSDQIRQYPANGSADLLPDCDENSYLVSITTDSIDQAGTVNRMDVNISYENNNGYIVETGKIDLIEALIENYGYWPSIDAHRAEWYKTKFASNVAFKYKELYEEIFYTGRDENLLFDDSDYVSKIRQTFDYNDPEVVTSTYINGLQVSPETAAYFTALKTLDPFYKLFGIDPYKITVSKLGEEDVPAGSQLAASVYLTESELALSPLYYGGLRWYARSGLTISFIISAADVKKFTGMEIHMEDALNNDEYQFTKVEIKRITDMGDLKTYYSCNSNDWIKVGEGTNASYLDRYIERVNMEFDESSKFTFGDDTKGYLVQPGNTVSLSFNTSEGTETEPTIKVDENKIIEVRKLTYDEAKVNYGLTKVRVTYNVMVQVDSEAYSSLTMGDTGSTNQFYFQLVFDKDGKKYTSSYVNANQQMLSDGFRSGQEESFYIYMNGDYGELTAINILPDDISNQETSFDKLKIKEIIVKKSSQGGLSYSYIIGDVGWIDIEYNDAEDDYVGRPESQIVRTFPVTDSTYTIDLEFALMTGSKAAPKGTYSAVIRYRDSSGLIRQKNINDLVVEIEAYANRSSGNSEGMVVSDPSYMFVANHVNRFKISFNNISSLIDITFRCKAESETDAGVWNIQNLSVRQVATDGTLRLKKNSSAGDTFGEYERDYGNGNVLELCTQSTSETMPKSVSVGSTSDSSVVLRFADGNKINAIANDGKIVIEQPVHVSEHDELVLTIVPGNTDTLNVGSYIDVNVRYYDIYANNNQVPGPSYKTLQNDPNDTTTGKVRLYYSSANRVFTTRFSTPKFCLPTEVNINSSVDLKILNIQLNQVRDGEVIQNGTFTSFDIEDEGSLIKAGEETSIKYDTVDVEYEDYYHQYAYIYFGEETGKVVTENKDDDGNVVSTSTTWNKVAIDATNDVGITFRYHMVDDTSTFFYSAGTVYLSSLGINEIYAGMTVKIPFEADKVDYIDSIGGLVTNKAMKVSIEKSAVEQIKKDAETKNETKGWFNGSSINSVTLSTKMQYITSKNGSAEEGLADISRLSGLDLEIVTAPDGKATSAVDMVVCYTDNNDELRTYYVSNIANFLNEGSLDNGATAKLTLLLTSVKAINQIMFEPQKSGDALGSWKLASCKYTTTVGVDATTVSPDAKTYVGDTGLTTTGNPLMVNFGGGSAGFAIGGTLEYGTHSEIFPNSEKLNNNGNYGWAITDFENEVNVVVKMNDISINGIEWVYTKKTITDSGNTSFEEVLENASGADTNTKVITLTSTGRYIITIYPRAKTAITEADKNALRSLAVKLEIEVTSPSSGS